MVQINDMIDGLIESSSRDRAAASHLGRLAEFISCERDRGFGCDASVEIFGGPTLKITLEVQPPAGEMPLPMYAGGVQEMFERLQEPLPSPVPEAIPEQKPERGAVWTEEEDAKAVRLAAAGLTAREIAKELDRPFEATKTRLCRKLRNRISTAKRAAQKPAAPAQPVKIDVPAVSPLGCVETDAVNDKIVASHLIWFYGTATPNTDLVKCDLDLVERLARGDKAQDVADALDWAKEDVIKRFKDLLGGHDCTLKLQMSLLVNLRLLAQRVVA